MDLSFLYGVLNLSFWGYVLVTFVMVQTTVMAVTLYLHRDAAHRSLELHSALRHFFRFWIWCTSGMITREWVAVHRKHHSFSDLPGDPHSPVIYGLRKVLWQGAELYELESQLPATLEKYGRGTPDDWLERKLYSRHRNFGIIALIVADLVLFGVPGIIIIAVQMMAMPLLAAGIINGVGHHSGYRNFECDDAARNIVPWALFLGGEELHNNHHAFPVSAKFSVRRWEFDIGWLYIRLLQSVGLARVSRTAPVPIKVAPRSYVDLENLRAVIVNRMHVLRDYSRKVTLPVLRAEIKELKRRAADSPLSRGVRKLLIRHPSLLDAQATARLKEILDRHHALKTVHEFRERLGQLWNGANASNERLLSHLKEWCIQAEASGIKVLQDFALTLRSYALHPA
jgi:stearoyl-CoA desaturase (delta-9 desaturase)